METDRNLIDHLLALKHYYQKKIEEYERVLIHARAQLEHTNALLLDQLERQHKQQANSHNQTESTSSYSTTTSTSEPLAPPSSTSSYSAITSTSASPTTSPPASIESIESTFSNSVIASTLESSNNTPSASTASDDLDLAIPKPTQQPVIPDLAQLSLELEPKEPIELLPKIDLVANSPLVGDLATTRQNRLFEVESASAKLPELDLEPNEKQLNSSSAIESNAIAEITRSQLPPQQSVGSPVASEESRKRSRHVNPLKTPLLPQYRHLTKSEAVEKLLQDHVGKVFYIDDITRAIHGDLGKAEIRAERGRIHDTLFKGVAKGLWQAVPDSTNYYTINLKSQEPTAQKPEPLPVTSSKPTTSRRSKHSDSMLPRYRQLSFTEAVAKVVQEKVGQTVTSEQVALELYGELKRKALTVAKDKAGKALWAGAKQGRWQRVPGRLGQYTLDIKLI